MALFIVGYKAEQRPCFARILEAVVLNPAAPADNTAFHVADAVAAAKKLDEWLAVVPAKERIILAGFKPKAFVDSLIADCGLHFYRTKLFAARNVTCVDIMSMINPLESPLADVLSTWKIEAPADWQPGVTPKLDALLAYKIYERFSG